MTMTARSIGGSVVARALTAASFAEFSAAMMQPCRTMVSAQPPAMTKTTYSSPAKWKLKKSSAL